MSKLGEGSVFAFSVMLGSQECESPLPDEQALERRHSYDNLSEIASEKNDKVTNET